MGSNQVAEPVSTFTRQKFGHAPDEFLCVELRNGLDQIWKNFWNSIRASAETDLMDKYGLRRACMWSGNSAATAMKNYALIRKEDYDDSGGDKSYAISDGNGQQAAAVENADTKKTVFPNNSLSEKTAEWAIQDSNNLQIPREIATFLNGFQNSTLSDAHLEHIADTLTWSLTSQVSAHQDDC